MFVSFRRQVVPALCVIHQCLRVETSQDSSARLNMVIHFNKLLWKIFIIKKKFCYIVPKMYVNEGQLFPIRFSVYKAAPRRSKLKLLYDIRPSGNRVNVQQNVRYTLPQNCICSNLEGKMFTKNNRLRKPIKCRFFLRCHLTQNLF